MVFNMMWADKVPDILVSKHIPGLELHKETMYGAKVLRVYYMDKPCIHAGNSIIICPYGHMGPIDFYKKYKKEGILPPRMFWYVRSKADLDGALEEKWINRLVDSLQKYFDAYELPTNEKNTGIYEHINCRVQYK